MWLPEGAERGRKGAGGREETSQRGAEQGTA